MVLVCESRNAPSHETAARPAIATPTRKEVYCEAFACKCGEVEVRGGTRSYHPGTFHCTRFHLGSAAF